MVANHHFPPVLTGLGAGRHAFQVLYRGPVKMRWRAGYGPRAVVWGPLIYMNEFSKCVQLHISCKLEL